MTSGWEEGKLQELRAKTDRQLLSLVNDELDAALRSDDNGDSAGAEHAYAEAVRLVPLLRYLSAGERARLEARLAEVRLRLDQPAAAACAN